MNLDFPMILVAATLVTGLVVEELARASAGLSSLRSSSPPPPAPH